MLHLNAKMKKLRTQPTKLKRRSDKKFEPKLVHEPPPQRVYWQYCRTSVVFPWP